MLAVFEGVQRRLEAVQADMKGSEKKVRHKSSVDLALQPEILRPDIEIFDWHVWPSSTQARQVQKDPLPHRQ